MKNLKFLFFFLSLFTAANLSAQAKQNKGNVTWKETGVMDTVTVFVKGKIADRQGKGIAWVRVELVSDQGARHSATTDKDGNFVFSHIGSGQYTFTARRDGYTQAVSGKIEFKSGSIIQMQVFLTEIKKENPLGIPKK